MILLLIFQLLFIIFIFRRIKICFLPISSIIYNFFFLIKCIRQLFSIIFFEKNENELKIFTKIITIRASPPRSLDGV